MTFKFWPSIIRLLPFALAAFPAFSAERHNVILLMPMVLPSAAVDQRSAPALARLKEEGVYFSNSHSGFPKLARHNFDAHGMDVLRLVSAAKASHSTKLVDDAAAAKRAASERKPLVDQSPSLNTIVHTVLPEFKAVNRPFVLVYRVSGGVQTADHALTAIESALRQLNLFDTTNIIVAAEQGASIVSKTSKTSATVEGLFNGARLDRMPRGFLGVDLTAALAKRYADVNLFDPRDPFRPLKPALGEHPTVGGAWIGKVADRRLVIVAPHGDHSFILLAEWLSKKDARRMAVTIIDAFFDQDYAGGVFVNERRIGTPRGTLPLRHIGWKDDHVPGMPDSVPDIIVTFISKSLECAQPTLCTATIADTPIPEGQQLPGSFSRADTWNFMAARGPDFQAGLTAKAPASNADVVKTIGRLLQLPGEWSPKSAARVLTESLRGNKEREPKVRQHVITSKASADGLTTEVHLQSVGSIKYFFAAGNSRWTVGIARLSKSTE